MAEKRRTTSTDIPPEGKEGKKGKKDDKDQKKKGEKEKHKDEKEKHKDEKEKHKDEKEKHKDEKDKNKDKNKDKDDQKKSKDEKVVSKSKMKPLREEPEEEIPKTESQLMRDEAEYRAMLRKQRFKRHWPEVTKVKIFTRPWTPPPPPQRMPPITVEMPEITTRKWVPPYKRRRRKRPPLPHIPAEEMTRQLYECAKLKKIWNNFTQVDKNKMILPGTIACNSKRYSSTHCGAQTACIAVICKTLLEEKPTSELTRHDVDDCIESGDRYYRQCMLALKCYKGKPQLELKQLLLSFFFHEAKYTVKMRELDSGLLAKHPDNVQAPPDLMALMEKRIGQEYSAILTVGDRHFLVWGGPPPPGSGSQCRTVCYVFDPHMLNELGQPSRLTHAIVHDNQQACCSPKFGAGAFLRYAGVTSFVLDFLANYGDLHAASKHTPKPAITFTEIEVVGREPLKREPRYEFDFKALKTHCDSEWQSLYKNTLYDRKRGGEFPLQCLSAMSVATSRATPKRKMRDFYQLTPKEPQVALPMAPEKAPPNPTYDNLIQTKGEDFFLFCARLDSYTFGRDDQIPHAKSETILHSPVDVAKISNRSNYHTHGGKGILRGTRHMASYRYQTFKIFTAIPCCVAALAMLRRLRARAWNEDTVDETLDLGYNLYRESLLVRGGPIRRLVLGELKDTLRIRDKEYYHRDRGIAVWGRLVSRNPKVFDIKRGLEQFFKESDAGVLQIPGEFETAVFNEGGKYYLYHPWPADRTGKRVGIREGGKACILCFPDIAHLADFFLEEVSDLKRKPFSISDVYVDVRPDMPEPVNDLMPVAPDRWVVRGTFHEGDARFPPEHRFKQATPCSIAAIALSHVVPGADWTKKEVDDTLMCGDALYQSTMEHLEKMGISLDNNKVDEETPEGEEPEEVQAGTLAAADVMNRFKVTDFDCIETEVLDSTYSGSLSPETQRGVANLKTSLRNLFKEHNHAVVTARGKSMAIWKKDEFMYFFDPHGCDENGFPSNEPRTAACLVRVGGSSDALAAVIEGNLPPGPDDSFNISPVLVTSTKLNVEIGAPETNLESKAFEWIKKGTAAIMLGPRSENSAIGKAADKCGIGDDDKAGRTIALPAAAAFCAATESVPPPHMHQDHMFNFLDAGAAYYQNLVKKTGKLNVEPEDLTEKFEMGANTFSIELGEPIRQPLRLPDPPPAEGEGGGDEKEMMGEGEQQPEQIKEMKDLLFKMWYDQTKPTQVSLLVGDYHQLGVWMSAGGPVVVFDPAPTLPRGVLTSHRIEKGDELRLQRIKDEMVGEGGGGDAEDEELGGEGEQQPEPEPLPVPRDTSPVLMIFASPGEFIDKLVAQGGLDKKQAIAPYKLYPVTVTNELTTDLKMKKSPLKKAEGDEAPADEEEVEEALVDPLDDAALGKHMTRIGRTTASVRGRLAQHEPYFLDSARGHQDGATSVMAIVVEHIEPYLFWKPVLIDAIVKYGDRLYTMSLRGASHPPRVRPSECQPEFHLTSFNIKLALTKDAVRGDIKAGETGSVLNIRRGILNFFNEHKHGVLCAKDYCVAIWKAMDDKAYVMFDPHAIGPAGRSSPGGGAGLVLYSTVEELAEVIKANVEGLNRPGHNKFSICAVKPTWEFSKLSGDVMHPGAVPDEGYEWKVLTAFVEIAKGRTILRGSRPLDLAKFARDSLLQSSCGAIVACCMTHVRRPHLWTRKTVDQIMCVGCSLFAESLGCLGYEFRPGEDLLLPLQVLKRFVLGVNYVRYELVSAYSGRLETSQPKSMNVKSALERFFEAHTHGILWCAPHAVAVWRVAGAPSYYMMEPQACGPNGLRADGHDDGAACVMTFSSPKLLSHAYLQNYPRLERSKHFFNLYVMSVVVNPIKSMKVEPPIVKGQPSVKGQPKIRLVPATSKVGMDGVKRRADEADRKHPPGGPSCKDAQRAADLRDKEETKLRGQRNPAGWLVLEDGSQFLSACHSIACRKFPYASRGNQALACSVMAVAMSRVENVCRWCNSTLDQIMQSGDQLYQDSYLHYKPETPILAMEQILRKFYTPGNCVCRVVVFKPRQSGTVTNDLVENLVQFFREEKCGVLVATPGTFAVALFKTPKGYYMFDPADRDRYGRAVPPPCIGRARACFSQFSDIESLAEKLIANIPPCIRVTKEPADALPSEKAEEKAPGEKKVKVDEPKEVSFEEPAKFSIYGMQVTSLRRLNEHEK